MLPHSTDYPTFYQPYVKRVMEPDVKKMLSASLVDLQQFVKSICESAADQRYEPGKWSVKEVLQHCIDSERIFAYRALCHARGEQLRLPGFDQNAYASVMETGLRSLESLVNESVLVRQSTVTLFENFTEKDLLRTGFVGETSIKTFCWAYIIAGHFIHHQEILINRYHLKPIS
ncbi:DinB family protein [Niabella insulamsoli]|uniref:DinB family protein n=1 Tax=Niabella insulamsoli TaxID=3144874 RepID=UPI0031FC6C6E